MSLRITLDISGRVIDQVTVQQVEKLDDDPGGERGYRVHADGQWLPERIYHHRRNGAEELARAALDYICRWRAGNDSGEGGT